MNISLENISWMFACLLAGIYTSVTAIPQWHIASDGTSYIVENEPSYNWFEAHSKCASHNSQLAVIDSAAKNQGFDELLRQLFVTAPNLWIGHHDNLNTAETTNRSFYSIVNGSEIKFSNWMKGEPNNHQKAEHCAQIRLGSDFQWNDDKCESKCGYVCEQPPEVSNVSCDLEETRTAINELNQVLAKDHENHSNEVHDTLTDNRLKTHSVLQEWQKSSMHTLNESQRSINELFARKPYLQAVIADVGPTIKQIIREAHNDISMLTKEAQQTIDGHSEHTQKSIMQGSEQFQQKLEENAKTIDDLLVQQSNSNNM
uniref:C-type lectin domain-containing protein n=1 Tax=Stomoxys calcitrans TaxID=35570 RepID=A0A1I8PWD7_STOCA